MKKLSTQCMDKCVNKTPEGQPMEESVPSRKTLDFLSRFARGYHAETNIEKNVCGVVLN